MSARILRFPSQAPIRLAMPTVNPGTNWTLLVALALNLGIWIGIGIVARRLFHG